MNRKITVAAMMIAALASCTGKIPEPQMGTVVDMKDHGNAPSVFDIETYTLENENFRTTLWTGTNLQLTLMTIPAGDDVGLEIHHGTEQFLRIEEGQGRVMMGSAEDRLDFVRDVQADDAILVPADTWHNLVNTGKEPLKLYSIYSPVEHPRGTVHKTHADAIEAEGTEP